MKSSRTRYWVLLAGLALFGLAQADTLDTPARLSALAERRAITALARAGASGLVAAGQRGHVLRSLDGGRSWTQASVPLSSDLTAVQFVNARTGYAVGHDGVVLRSDDGGATWRRLLDGRTANALLLQHMEALAQAGGGEETQRLLAEARRNVEAGPDKPFLDLFFSSAEEGYVVGAYNLIFHTIDGGKSWLPLFDRTDNPKLFNLYAIRADRGTLFIAGEGGLLLRWDERTQRFQALVSPYAGSFFGLVATRAGLIAYGMRGHAFLSRDRGQSWVALDTGLTASITAADALPGGRTVLVDQAGSIALSQDGGEHFARQTSPSPAPLSAIALTANGAAIGGPRGLAEFVTKEKP